MASPNALSSSLTKLSLHPTPSKSSGSFKIIQPVADSWEDEELASGEEADQQHPPLSPQQSADFPSAPPPTPSSPPSSFNRESFTNPYGYGSESIRDAMTERATGRPEKTDAVAKRMIAGALGIKAPKKTEELKAYDKAIREKEIKRRDEEKAAAKKAQEDAERAKQAVWSD